MKMLKKPMPGSIFRIDLFSTKKWTSGKSCEPGRI